MNAKRIQPHLSPSSANWHIEASGLGDLGSGAQIVVIVDGETRVSAFCGKDGTGRNVEPDSLFSIYCASKPFLAIVLAILDQQGILPLETTIGSVLPNVQPRVSTLTLVDVLSQGACLVRPLGIEGILGIGVLGEKLIEAIDAGPGYNRPGITGYSEFAGWFILREIVSRVTERSVGSLIEELVLRPLSLDGEIFSDMEQMSPADTGRIRTNLAIRPDRKTAALVEATSVFRKYAGDGVGAFATMFGLASFYQSMLGLSGGVESAIDIDPQALQRLLTPRPEAFDTLLQRKCTYGLGFMTKLQAHGFGEKVSGQAFGHVGLMGMTVGFCDPSTKLSVAWHSNGMTPNDSTVLDRRASLVDAIYGRVIECEGAPD